MKTSLVAHREGVPARSRRRAARGFTLIEILVAIAIFSLMLAIIFVPLNMGFNAFNIGNSRSQVQQAANTTVAQMEREVRSAIYVYPNDAVPGVSNNAPYDRIAKVNPNPTPATSHALPYYRQTAPNSNAGACDAPSGGVVTTSNTSRLDFIVPRRNGDSVVAPLAPAFYIVTYYARRLDATKPYDAVDNPMVLFRAQMPYRNKDAAESPYLVSNSPPVFNLQTDSTRYPTSSDCSNANAVNRGAQWLTQTRENELNLEPLCSDATGVPSSHTLVTPRGMGLIVPHANDAPPAIPDLTPTTTFTCQDTDGDGKIDRVTLRLILGNYTSNGQTRNGNPLVQSQGLPQAVDLPNVK